MGHEGCWRFRGRLPRLPALAGSTLLLRVTLSHAVRLFLQSECVGEITERESPRWAP